MNRTNKPPFPILQPLPVELDPGHHWLVEQQQRLAEKVGEPLFITIQLVFDGTVVVEVNTFTGREGQGAGPLLFQALEDAVEMLLYLDPFVQQVAD